jgi:hypothetical protein
MAAFWFTWAPFVRIFPKEGPNKANSGLTASHGGKKRGKKNMVNGKPGRPKKITSPTTPGARKKRTSPVASKPLDDGIIRVNFDLSRADHVKLKVFAAKSGCSMADLLRAFVAQLKLTGVK